MSIIEDEAIPVASSLIKGETFLLDEDSQHKLAAFLCLISMRLQFLGRMHAIPAVDRLYLKENGCPPALWAIWLARYAGEKPDEHWSRFLGMQLGSTPTDKVGPDHCNTQVTTLVIGKLCAHLFSSTETPVLGYEGIRLTRIWPPTGLGIGTEFIPPVTDKAIIWLHEALARESKPLPKT
jgi:hypothetical protein